MLVVVDDEGVRVVLRCLIEELGYEVCAAADAYGALRLLEEVSVDVAFVDIKMPGHDGIWLIDQLRREHPDVRIVIATGLEELDPVVTLRPGILGYLVKPFESQALMDVLAQVPPPSLQHQLR